MEKSPQLNREHWLFVVLAGLFITCAVTAELISNKLIQIPLEFHLFGSKIGPFETIVGVLPWPIVFLLTDLLNEFYGAKAVRRLSWITAAMIGVAFLIISLAMAVPAKVIEGSSLASDAEFNKMLGQAKMVIIGSIAAFLLSQLLDVLIFQWVKKRTGNRFIWLRSTGSTVFSQLIDSVVVLYIGFVVPGTITMSQFFEVAPTNYFLKLLIAIALTPFIYILHFVVKKYFFRPQS
ncbi:MAG: queuosine precursor transporter [Bacteroidota bacterium]